MAFPNIAARLTDPIEDPKGLAEEIRRLLDLYITSWSFDEDHYLRTYPDVAKAVGSGQFTSGWSHFRTVGYLEGRLPIKVAIDADWYFKTYPDVAAASLKNPVNAEWHFLTHGYREGRMPHSPKINPS